MVSFEECFQGSPPAVFIILTWQSLSWAWNTITQIHVFIPLVAIGALLTLGTGLVLFFVLFNPGGAVDTWYGFPLPWKETAYIFCGPFNPPPCLSDIILIIYNPVFFIADVAFYTLVGYVLLRIYSKFRLKKQFSTSAKTPETTQILGLDMF